MKTKWCPWAERACPKTCPIPSVDNRGQAYPGCALVRLKSEAELEAERRDPIFVAGPKGTPSQGG